LSFASGAILFVIRADDKYLKSIKPITGIDARFNYINFSNRPLRILLTHNFGPEWRALCIYPFQSGSAGDFPGARHVVAGHLTVPREIFSAQSNISNDERTTIHPADSSRPKMSEQTYIKRWPLARRYFFKKTEALMPPHDSARGAVRQP
jgi:hypothetical protein